MKEKILILVKTYPTFSKKHFELVCTAGVNEQGEWRRIYPIPFRELERNKQYKKFQWVEMDIARNPEDKRPESYKLISGIKDSAHVEKLSTDNNWQERKDALKNTPVYKNLSEIIKLAKSNKISLCQFIPHKIKKLKVDKVKEREWDDSVLETIENINAQQSLFKDAKRVIRLVHKLPYKFSYVFVDDEGKESTLMVEDWELGQLYWNCLKRHKDEKIACDKVKEKYESFIRKNDIIFFLGTTKEFHQRARNPFIIIGVFYPLKQNRLI